MFLKNLTALIFLSAPAWTITMADSAPRGASHSSGPICVSGASSIDTMQRPSSLVAVPLFSLPSLSKIGACFQVPERLSGILILFGSAGLGLLCCRANSDRSKKVLGSHRIWQMGLRSALPVVLGATAAASLAHASAIGPGAFTDPSITTFDGLGLPFNISPPLLVGGNTISSDYDFIYTTHALCPSANSECFVANGLNAPLYSVRTPYLEIVLGTPVVKAGAWAGNSIQGRFDFFDEADVLLGSVTGGFQISGNLTFFGAWEADAGLIKTIRLTDIYPAGGRAVMLDDLTVENNGPNAVPEPGTLILLLAGLAGLGGREIRFRRRREV
jgi:hypothetical protein